MALSGSSVDMLPLLYQQHYQYTTELGRTYQALSKLYKKLAKVERFLAEKQEREVPRSERRKRQYTRALSKRTIANLESQQATLHDALRQCNNLIAFCEIGTYSLSLTQWTTETRSCPHIVTPYSPVAYQPWMTNSQRSSMAVQDGCNPQYWDLSMLRERRQSSPITSSADSGYYEPAAHGFEMHTDPFDFSNHMYSHELMPPLHNSVLYPPFTVARKSNPSPSPCERDDVPPPRSLTSPAKVGAQRGSNQHKRGHSVDVIRASVCRHVAPLPKRGASVGPASDRATHVEHVELGEGREEVGLGTTYAAE